MQEFKLIRRLLEFQLISGSLAYDSKKQIAKILFFLDVCVCVCVSRDMCAPCNRHAYPCRFKSEH